MPPCISVEFVIVSCHHCVHKNRHNRSVSHAGETADSFCERCVKQAGSLLLPGLQFDSNPTEAFNTSFRIGYGRKNMPECLSKLNTFLELL